jgi:hypothetical protein
MDVPSENRKDAAVPPASARLPMLIFSATEMVELAAEDRLRVSSPVNDTVAWRKGSKVIVNMVTIAPRIAQFLSHPKY